MSEVESHINGIINNYLIEKISMSTFNKIKKDLSNFKIDGQEYEVKKAQFIIDDVKRGDITINGKIYNKSLNEEYGDLNLKIENTK